MDGTATRVLVAWYGIYQAGHLVFIAVGAWAGHLAAYLALYGPFLPVVALYALWCVHRAREQ